MVLLGEFGQSDGSANIDDSDDVDVVSLMVLTTRLRSKTCARN